MDSKLFASYALFAELAKEKKNIYEVIRFYIISFLAETQKRTFSLVEFANDFNSFYNFKIPHAVLKSSLHKLDGCVLSQKIYTINFDSLPKIQSAKLSETNSKFRNLENSLIADVLNEKCTESEKQEILDAFFKFLKDEPVQNHFRKKISKFILQNDNNEFGQQINDLREGIIIYEGIASDLDLNSLGKWKTNITLYFTTEILFDIFGLNGLFYQQQAEDFLNLVKEINKKEVFVKLRYFDSIKKETEFYFASAKCYITDNKFPKIDTAMKEILDRASTLDEILELKNKFFNYLEDSKICNEKDCELSDESNYQYNLISEDENFGIMDEKKLYLYSNLLNNINILRKNMSNQKLTDVRFLLVTRNHRIIELSKNKKFYNDGDFYKSVSLDFITTKFWFYLNKGFGSRTSYKSLDMFYKSRMVISSMINANVAKKYTELIERQKTNPLNVDVVRETVFDLRNELKKPEEIENNNIDLWEASLSIENLDAQLEEIEIRKRKEKEIEAENIKIKQENVQLKKEKRNANILIYLLLIGVIVFILFRDVLPIIVNKFFENKKEVEERVQKILKIISSFGGICGGISALLCFIKWITNKCKIVKRKLETK